MNRLELAIELLKERKWCSIDNISLEIPNQYEVNISCGTDCFYLENVTKAQVLEDLSYLKNTFQELLESMPELKELLEGKKRIFKIFHDVYRDSLIWICTERDGEIEWLLSVKD